MNNSSLNLFMELSMSFYQNEEDLNPYVRQDCEVSIKFNFDSRKPLSILSIVNY